MKKHCTFYDRIPEDTPNKDYYKDVVCCCTEYADIDVSPTIEEQEIYGKDSKAIIVLCTRCRKLTPYSLNVCKQCGSAFVDTFFHKKQVYGYDPVRGNSKMYCWNCLELKTFNAKVKYPPGVMTMKAHVPPAPRMLNPKVAILSFEEKFGESLDSFLDSLL